MTDLWIGTTSKMVTIPAPELPFSVTDAGYGDSMDFENGGAAATGSAAFSKRYDFAYSIEDASLLSQVRRLRQGSYGTGLIYFADPATFHRNVLPAHWAEPGLLEHDWPDTADSAPSFGNVSSNSYDQPLRKATWTVTATANTAPTEAHSSVIIPIPPAYTLWLGVSGAATGTAVQMVTAHNIAAGTSAATALTLLTDTSSTRLNASFAGSSYDYVRLYGEWRTSSASSTLTVTSRLAQLWPTGTTPTLTGNHVPGEGNSGCRFLGGSMEHRYRLLRDSARWDGLGFSLIETGAWE